MAKAYRLTSARMRSIKKAQLISARKRKGKRLKINRKAAIAATIGTGVALTGVAAYARHKASGSVLAGPFPREATPSTSLAGVQLPVVRSGMRIANFGKDGFAVTVRHRNSKGDKLLLSYRHIPLGRKISGGPAEVVKFKPDSAHPSDLHMDVLDSFPTRTADRGRNRYVKGALTDEGRSRRNVLRFRTDTSISARQMAKKPLPNNEVISRANMYREIVEGRGVKVNQAHMNLAREILRKQMM